MPSDGPFGKFECDHCGACCRHLLVEASWADAQREPRLYEIAPKATYAGLRSGEQAVMLYDTARRCCPFLTDANEVGARRCEIYATRPNECVAVEAGDAKCQQAREMAGLPILLDRDGAKPDAAAMAKSVEDYGLDWTPYE